MCLAIGFGTQLLLLETLCITSQACSFAERTCLVLAAGDSMGQATWMDGGREGGGCAVSGGLYWFLYKGSRSSVSKILL